MWCTFLGRDQRHFVLSVYHLQNRRHFESVSPCDDVSCYRLMAPNCRPSGPSAACKNLDKNFSKNSRGKKCQINCWKRWGFTLLKYYYYYKIVSEEKTRKMICTRSEPRTPWSWSFWPPNSFLQRYPACLSSSLLGVQGDYVAGTSWTCHRDGLNRSQGQVEHVWRTSRICRRSKLDRSQGLSWICRRGKLNMWHGQLNMLQGLVEHVAGTRLFGRRHCIMFKTWQRGQKKPCDYVEENIINKDDNNETLRDFVKEKLSHLGVLVYTSYTKW